MVRCERSSMISMTFLWSAVGCAVTGPCGGCSGKFTTLPGGENRTPLHFAAEDGDAARVAALLAKGASVAGADAGGWSPLHCAASRPYNREVVQLLLSRGAAVNAEDRAGLTPLGVGARKGHVGAVRALLSAKADVHVKDREGYTPLSHAAWEGRMEIANLLISAGAVVDGYCAAGLGRRRELISLLSSDPGLLHRKDRKGRALVHWAAANGEVAVVEVLANQGARIDTADTASRTPLAVAVERGHCRCVRFLLDKGARWPGFKAGALPRVLVRAARQGDKEMVSLLLSRGVDVNASPKEGPTALHMATAGNQLRMAQYLLSKGAAVETPSYGVTVLQLSAGAGRVRFAELFLEEGAHVNAAGKSGQTALHRAVLRGGRMRKEMVRLLLANGASATAKDQFGRSPLDWARKGGHDEIVQILQDHLVRER